eukprot:1321353-Pleurochrysis_carterae.AAC.1
MALALEPHSPFPEGVSAWYPSFPGGKVHEKTAQGLCQPGPYQRVGHYNQRFLRAVLGLSASNIRSACLHYFWIRRSTHPFQMT